MKNRFPPLLALVSLLAGASLFWPGPYRYDELGLGGGHSSLVRVNRFTGRTEVFIPSSGWNDRHPGAIPTAPLIVFVGGTALALAFGAGLYVGRRGQ